MNAIKSSKILSYRSSISGLPNFFIHDKKAVKVDENDSNLFTRRD